MRLRNGQVGAGFNGDDPPALPDVFLGKWRVLASAILGVGIALFLSCGVLRAQGNYGPGDGLTQTAVAPGTPESSYALGNVDNINYFSGNLNVTIPLYRVGGRGKAGFDIVLPIERMWRIENHSSDSSVSYAITSYGMPINGGPGSGFSRYMAGGMTGRPAADQQFGDRCPDGTYHLLGQSLTSFNFTEPNGTQHRLVDTLTGGAPHNNEGNNCATGANSVSRGATFVSSDATSMTFVADSTVYDDIIKPMAPTISRSGWLYFRDGTRYHFSTATGSSADKIEDVNGNQVIINGGTITDSAGRQITITRADLSSTFQDVVTYPGHGGPTHQIVVYYALLGTVLRSGYSLRALNNLFPIPGAPTGTYNPYVVSSVVFPDGTSYTMLYNSYGELARLTLPTGGAFEYDFPTSMPWPTGGDMYAAILHTGPGLGGQNNLAPYRRIKEKRVYADGVTLTSRTLFVPAEISGQYTVTAQKQNGSGTLMAADRHYFGGDPTSIVAYWGPPDVFYSHWADGHEFETEWLQQDGTTVMKRLDTTWTQRALAPGETWYLDGMYTTPAHDPQITQEVTTLLDTNLVSKVTYAYDRYNNKSDTSEYAWGTGAAGSLLKDTQAVYNTGATYIAQSCPADGNGQITQNCHMLNLPITVTTYLGGTQVGLTTNTYDAYTGGATLDAASGIVAHNSYFGTSLQVRGNLTTQQQWLDTGGSSPTTYYSHDIGGNLTRVRDPLVHDTSYGYADGSNTYSHVTSRTDALGEGMSWTYDLAIGKPTAFTDVNGAVTHYEYADPLDRLTKVRRGYGSGIESDTAYTYNSATQVTVQQDKTATGDGLLKTVTLYDGLGRDIETDVYETPTQYIASKKGYDALGRIGWTKNPSRPGDGLDYQTTYSYDALDRTTQVQTSDLAAVTTSYSGNQTTVTDQAGKVRVTTTDALGRITAVVEDPGGGRLNYTTTYSYTGLTMGVSQSGRNRTFTNDSLGRLVTAVNPESGTVNYTYNGVGNLLTKTDAAERDHHVWL